MNTIQNQPQFRKNHSLGANDDKPTDSVPEKLSSPSYLSSVAMPAIAGVSLSLGHMNLNSAEGPTPDRAMPCRRRPPIPLFPRKSDVLPHRVRDSG